MDPRIPVYKHVYDFYESTRFKRAMMLLFSISFLSVFLGKIIPSSDVLNGPVYLICMSAITTLSAFLAFPKLTSYVYERPDEFQDLVDTTAISEFGKYKCQCFVKVLMCFISASIVCWLVYFFQFKWPTITDSGDVVFGAISGFIALYLKFQTSAYQWALALGSWWIRWKKKHHLECLLPMSPEGSTQASPSSSLPPLPAIDQKTTSPSEISLAVL